MRLLGFELYRVVWSAPIYPDLRQDICTRGWQELWARDASDAVRRARRRWSEPMRVDEVFPA